jgi:hypothetical protein
VARRKSDEAGNYFQDGEPQAADHGDDHRITVSGEPQKWQRFPNPRFSNPDASGRDKRYEPNNIRRRVCGYEEYDRAMDGVGAKKRYGEQPKGQTVRAPGECSASE